jgi:hypothetical protein
MHGRFAGCPALHLVGGYVHGVAVVGVPSRCEGECEVAIVPMPMQISNHTERQRLRAEFGGIAAS